MTKNGRLTDVFITEKYVKDDATGTESFSCLVVWMDKNAMVAVALILGVDYVTRSGSSYMVFLDPRYDREYLKREIEAQAKIHAEE